CHVRLPQAHFVCEQRPAVACDDRGQSLGGGDLVRREPRWPCVRRQRCAVEQRPRRAADDVARRRSPRPRRPRRREGDGEGFRHRRGEATTEIGPHHPMRRESEPRAEQLPRWAGFIVRSPTQPFLMLRQPRRELVGESRERQAVGSMRPQYIAAWTAAPRGDVAPADGWSRSRTFPIDYEQIIGARLHAELRRPAITDGGEFGAEAKVDAVGAGRENPGTIVLEQALWNRGCRRLCPQG